MFYFYNNGKKNIKQKFTTWIDKYTNYKKKFSISIRKVKGGKFNPRRVRVFNATFNNISVISWQSVLLVEETKVPRQNHRAVASSKTYIANKLVITQFDM